MPDKHKFLGCDPDLSTMPIAIVDEDLNILDIHVFRNESEHGGVFGMMESLRNRNKWAWCTCEAVAVEGQMIYPKSAGKQPPPNDILHLGQVAGYMLACLAQTCWTLYFPTPAEWKGQIDKLAHHRRILTKSHIPESAWLKGGGREPYLGVREFGGIERLDAINPGDWKHITDAIGLAQYAAERWKAETLKKRLLQEARNGKPNPDPPDNPDPRPNYFPCQFP